MSAFALDFSHVATFRGTSEILHDLTFKIKKGECVAVLGPNGSGKSTLIKLMTRELYPTKGSFRIFGETKWDVIDLRSRLGIVSNDLHSTFTQDMTGLDVVLSGFFSSVGLWTNHHVTVVMQKKAHQILKKLDLLYLRERKMDKISSGEARRLLIARALIHSPRTLVFDEPTNSLDLKAQHEFRLTLRRLARSGIGIILATHHLPDIIPEIKRIIVLKEGRVKADGRKEDIFNSKILGNLFDVSIDIIKKNSYYHGL